MSCLICDHVRYYDTRRYKIAVANSCDENFANF